MFDRLKPGRRTLRVALAVLLVLVGTGGWIAHQNSYALREEPVIITGAATPLHGVLALPPHGDGPFGLVVFVHGDGPVDATYDTFYRPIWESLAQAGYGSLSWNKPGVDGAPGDWLDQTMSDRAEETTHAIAWARDRPEIDPDRIGLWGASQAGWVLPEVVAHDPRLRFMIAVSPAINWLQQGRYNLIAELTESGATQEEVAAALAQREKDLRYLRAGASYARARAAGAATDISEQRWRFAQRNYTADASADLTRVRIPVLLQLGGHDLNVDIADTEAGYRRNLPDQSLLDIVHHQEATHAMVRADIADSTVKSTLVALFAPRNLYAPGVLHTQRDFVAKVAPLP
ncbi:alpha/beta hydrolase family protein [Nocardia sp. 004]|uniref:alpha/beta hydrolase family protein n=1 Tax=Nocardia sp. 004 TaxID=3385978 RepID=UPI0039A1F5D4